MKKMLRSHLCFLPKRIITIFLHVEGIIDSFDDIKKNVMSTNYRESVAKLNFRFQTSSLVPPQSFKP